MSAAGGAVPAPATGGSIPGATSAAVPTALGGGGSSGFGGGTGLVEAPPAALLSLDSLALVLVFGTLLF
jgi:hypothetical protein